MSRHRDAATEMYSDEIHVLVSLIHRLSMGACDDFLVQGVEDRVTWE